MLSIGVFFWCCPLMLRSFSIIPWSFLQDALLFFQLALDFMVVLWCCPLILSPYVVHCSLHLLIFLISHFFSEPSCSFRHLSFLSIPWSCSFSVSPLLTNFRTLSFPQHALNLLDGTPPRPWSFSIPPSLLFYVWPFLLFRHCLLPISRSSYAPTSTSPLWHSPWFFETFAHFLFIFISSFILNILRLL